MDILEDVEAIGLLTGGGSEVFKKVDALVNKLMLNIQQLTLEKQQLELLIKASLPYLENMCDEGPPGEGWKSGSLEQIISSAEQVTVNTPLWGTAIKRTEFCRCDETIVTNLLQDCGCAFGQCAKGLIY